MSIRLHKEKGVNPKLTVCRRCGGKADELMLIGAMDYKDICRECGTVHYGGAFNLRTGRKRCQNCDSVGFDREPIGEYEKIPASEPCSKCKEELAQHKVEVDKGGIYFKCKDCNRSGVVKADHPLAVDVRKHTKIEAPNPVGIEFDKGNCPVCRKE